MARNFRKNFLKNKNKDQDFELNQRFDVDNDLLEVSNNSSSSVTLQENAHITITEDADDYFIQEPGFSNPVVIFDLKDYLDIEPGTDVTFKSELIEYYPFESGIGNTAFHWLKINNDGTVKVVDPNTFDRYQEGESINDNIEFTVYVGSNQTEYNFSIPLTVEGINDIPFLLYDNDLPNFNNPIEIDYYNQFTESSAFQFKDDFRDFDNSWNSLRVDESSIVAKVNGEIVEDFVIVGKQGTSFEHIIFNYNLIDQPAPGEYYDVEVSFRVTDGIDVSDDIAIRTFRLHSPEGAGDSSNDVPIANNDLNIAINEGDDLTYNILNNDYDIDFQDEIKLDEITNLNVNGNLIDQSSISDYIVFDSEGNISFGPELQDLEINSLDNFVISFDYNISDNLGAESSAEAKITILADDEIIDDIDQDNDVTDNPEENVSIELVEAYFGDQNSDSNLIYDDSNEDPSLNTNIIDMQIAGQGFVDIASFRVEGEDDASSISATIFTSDFNIDMSNINLGQDYALINNIEDEGVSAIFRLYESGYNKITDQLEAYNPSTFFVSVETYEDGILKEALMEFDIVKNSFDNISSSNSTKPIKASPETSDFIDQVELESFSFVDKGGYNEVENIDLVIDMNQGRVNRPNFESEKTNQENIRLEIDSFVFEIDNNDDFI